MGKKKDQKKSIIHASVDGDVFEALTKEAASKRLTVSALLNSVLAERMQEELARKTAKWNSQSASA